MGPHTIVHRTKEFNFYIWGIWTQMMARSGPEPTIRTFWKIICWSFDALATGRFPTRSPDGVKYDPNTADGQLAGQYLADGYFAVIWVPQRGFETL